LFKRKKHDVNLIILSENDQNCDDLTFLTWFSFNRNLSGVKPLIIRKKRTQSNIHYWANSFNIFSMVGDYNLKKIDNFNFLDKSYFVIKSGILFSKSDLDLDKSFDLFDTYGIFYKNKSSSFFYDNNDLIGNLDNDTSTMFIDINNWVKNLSMLKLSNKLNQCYGHPKFLKGNGTTNEINFGYILKDAYGVYSNFPEVTNG
jgi:hypothetical protein